jgi:hypothetical protein
MTRTGLVRPLLILLVGLTFVFASLARTERGSSPTRMQGSGYPAVATGTTTQTAAAYQAPGVRSTQTVTTTTRTATTATTTTTTATAQVPAANPTATVTLAAEVQAPTMPPTPTATLELTGNVVCTPGQRLTISGAGPPRAPILLYFGRRIVGGGSVGPDGTFSLPLQVGAERGGDYPVAVRVRGSGQVLTEFMCAVPAVTPTPLPGRRAIP